MLRHRLHQEAPACFNLLKAASFGRHFLTEASGCPDRHREACRSLRICRELRKAPVEMPLTPAQLEKLTVQATQVVHLENEGKWMVF